MFSKTKDENILATKSAEGLTLLNERTGASVTIPADSSRWQIHEAKQAIRTPARFAGPTAREGMVLITGSTPAPTAEREADPEPYVPLSDGLLRRQRLELHAQWQARQDAIAQREREIEDRRAVIDGIAETLRNPPTPEPQAPPDELVSTFQQRLEQVLAQGSTEQQEGGQ